MHPTLPAANPPAGLPASLQVLTHLGGMPDTTMKWQTAAASLGPYPPIVRLLGYFTAGQTAQAQSMLQASPARCYCAPAARQGM